MREEIKENIFVISSRICGDLVLFRDFLYLHWFIFKGNLIFGEIQRNKIEYIWGGT